MKQFRATIYSDRYPLEFSVEAASWPTAAARLIRLWQKRFKGSHTESLTIKMVRVDV